MELGLKNKNVLVTGSTKGLGKAIAAAFAEEGANVIISGRNQAEGEQLAEDMKRKYNVKVAMIPADLLKDGEAERLFASSLDVFKSLDVLVNNAAIWPTAYVKDMEKEDFERTMYLNLEVPYILSRLMVNHLLEQGKKGKIVNIASQAAFHGATTGHAHYASSKAGLVGFMISQAREVAKYGININAIAPGMIRTPMLAENATRGDDYYINRIPIGRIAEPEEIAPAAVFLGSSKADYFTGITFDASGGMLMR